MLLRAVILSIYDTEMRYRNTIQKYGTDGTEYGTDGTEYGTDGTEYGTKIMIQKIAKRRTIWKSQQD